MINAIALLSIRIFTYLKVLIMSFHKMLISSEFFLCILSLGIDSPKVMGTKSSCVQDSKFWLFLLEFDWLTRQERKDWQFPANFFKSIPVVCCSEVHKCQEIL